MGGGLAGLSAAYGLSKRKKVIVCERKSAVGGLSRTFTKNGFRFDIGGHRFFTKNKRIEEFVKGLMGSELILVPRTSKIYFRRRYFNYPLTPFNALFGVGLLTTMRILLDYSLECLRSSAGKRKIVSLEDWVVSKFGRTMFNLYFKEYSEKVWGIGCNRVCAEWVEGRIKGMSLKMAIKNALFKSKGDTKTLIDKFFYPVHGIGRISEALKDKIDGSILLNTEVTKINYNNFKITSVEVNTERSRKLVSSDIFVSSIPVTHFINIMHPLPPSDVLDAAKKLRYRDLITVNLMLNRRRVTDVKWMYIHDPEIPFGRIHEPKNWSVKMAPEGKTSLVVEYFCFAGDEIWKISDSKLVRVTVDILVNKLGFITEEDVIESMVLRIKNAYPLYEIGYEKHYSKVREYLSCFKNLKVIGRGGRYKYLNMDHAIEDGLEAAETIP